MPSLSASLAVGFFGALVGAAFSYLIRRSLDARAMVAADQRIAYVHFIRFSDFVAMQLVTKNMIEVMIPVEAIKSLGKEGHYRPSHEMCVRLAKMIREGSNSTMMDHSLSQLVHTALDVQLDDMKTAKLSLENLSKLPRESVLEYSIFLTQLSSVEGALKLWTHWAKTGDSKWVTAEVLYDQWSLIQRLTKTSARMRSALLFASGMSPEEGKEATRVHIDEYTKIFRDKLSDRIELKSAAETIFEGQGPDTSIVSS